VWSKEYDVHSGCLRVDVLGGVERNVNVSQVEDCCVSRIAGQKNKQKETSMKAEEEKRKAHQRRKLPWVPRERGEKTKVRLSLTSGGQKSFGE